MSNEHSRIERLTGRERRRIRQALLGFALCVAFYSVQYALRSAPTVMLADLARAFNISSVDVGDLSSIFLYTYALESAEFSAIFWQPVTYAHSRRATARSGLFNALYN
jgi:sugar phosphate permease